MIICCELMSNALTNNTYKLGLMKFCPYCGDKIMVKTDLMTVVSKPVSKPVSKQGERNANNNS